MSSLDISVIIVTFNSAETIEACVNSVLSQVGVEFEVIIVDNSSSDDTLKRLARFDCQVIGNPDNLGFGRGCNLGFDSSRGRYIYLLNPDAHLNQPDALRRLCHQMDSKTAWGMAGTMIRSPDGQTEYAPATGYPGDRHIHRDFSSLPGRIAWVMGASMFIRRELYEKLGGFDPDFFLYSEETDFCLRMRELGFEIGHIPDVVVSHIGGSSEDQRDPFQLSARKLRGLLTFRQKHYLPRDCVFLAKRDLRRAWFRMNWNALLARFKPPRSKYWQKSRVYRGIWEVSSQYLRIENKNQHLKHAVASITSQPEVRM